MCREGGGGALLVLDPRTPLPRFKVAAAAQGSGLSATGEGSGLTSASRGLCCNPYLPSASSGAVRVLRGGEVGNVSAGDPPLAAVLWGEAVCLEVEDRETLNRQSEVPLTP